MSRPGEFREIKFLLPPGVDTSVAAAFGPVSCPDHHGQDGQYDVFSLYFDTAQRDCLFDKIEGEEYKLKVRWRCYRTGGPDGAGSPDSTGSPDGAKGGWGNHHLEIKLRRRELVAKRRVALTSVQAIALLETGIDGSLLERLGLPPAVFGREAPWWKGPMRPAVAIKYRRTARLVDWLPGCRLTFDRGVLASTPGAPWDIDGEPDHTTRRIPVATIFEIKTDGVVPQTFIEILRRFDSTPVSVSKFGLGMTAIPGGAR